MKTKSHFRTLKNKCWKEFSEYIRLRDADEGGTTRCYTCSRPLFWKEAQCGHAIGGRHMAVLFDADICRPQCYRCNVPMRGNYPIFTAKLIREHGLEWFEKKLEGSRRVVKYSRSDLEVLLENLKELRSLRSKVSSQDERRMGGEAGSLRAG
jgi:hypothetical protein